ncbi:MAG: phenylalanine--tRNA ligase subunit alpha, partial [Rhodospirillales bacterium]
MKELDALRSELMAAVESAGGLDDLEQIRVSALGRKGRITELMKGLGAMNADTRKEAGQALNALKTAVADAIEERKSAFADTELDSRLAAEKVDVTLPVRPEQEGRVHPISQTIDEVVAILGEMGLAVAEGPDIEDDWHNFTALNIPPDHPARQEHDTFYLPGGGEDERLVLR